MMPSEMSSDDSDDDSQTDRYHDADICFLSLSCIPYNGVLLDFMTTFVFVYYKLGY